MALAHKLDGVPRTADIRSGQDITFDSMLLSDYTYTGLKSAGFYKPSPIQYKGIPMGKCGFDLLLEAKSGTGKTAVFTIIALDMLDINNGTQVLILAPTREIAAQIASVIRQIGVAITGLQVEVVIGGLPVNEDITKFSNDRKVHIVVGSPGRIRHLINDSILDTSGVRLLVIDEADKLMDEAFQSDINYIYSMLPERKQVIASSATFSKNLRELIEKYMRKPCHICPDTTNILLGIAQKLVIVDEASNVTKQTRLRYTELIKIFRSFQFKQCLIFCNYQARVKELNHMLTRDKWPVETLHGGQEQLDRLEALKTLQDFKCRILIATDLAARGIDASNVDLVINFEPPYEWATYLHRIGRAGRYGSYGTAISLVAKGKELKAFNEIINFIGSGVKLYDFWSNELVDATPITEKDADNPVLSIDKKESEIFSNHCDKEFLRMILDKESSGTKIETFEEILSSYKSTRSRSDTYENLLNSYKSHTLEKPVIEFKSLTVPSQDNMQSNGITADKVKNGDKNENCCISEKTKLNEIAEIKCKKSKKKKSWLRPYHKEYYEADVSISNEYSKTQYKSSNKIIENGHSKDLIYNGNGIDENGMIEENSNEDDHFYSDNREKYDANYGYNGNYDENDYDHDGETYDENNYYNHDGEAYDENDYYNHDGEIYDENDHYNHDKDECYDHDGEIYNEDEYYDANEDYTEENNEPEYFNTKNLGEVKLSDTKNFEGITKDQKCCDVSVCSKKETKLKHKKSSKSDTEYLAYKAWKTQIELTAFQLQYAYYVREMSSI